MELLIETLTEQLQKVIKEHPTEVESDTYWRGVKIGLETAIEVARTLKNNSVLDDVIGQSGQLFCPCCKSDRVTELEYTPQYVCLKCYSVWGK